MKRYIFILIIGLILVTLTIINHGKTSKQKIVVAEVTHSVFYAPWYVALNNTYFDDLNIEVILTSGANNVTSAIISGDADIGLCGMEAIIYAYSGGEKNLQSFASLTKRDGQFLILRNNIKYKKMNDLNGLVILSGRSGGMPLINFRQSLKNQGVKNVTIDASIDFANLSAAFISGYGDGVNLFEPNATMLEKSGYGYIATNIGTYSNIVPYTTFNAKKSYINNNPTVIKKFISGINKGLEYVSTHSSREIANIIIKEFPDTKIEDLIKMIDNYKNADSWFKTSIIPEYAYNNLYNMIIDNNILKERIPYVELVYESNRDK